MVDLCLECDLWGLEGVVGGEVDGGKEDAPLVGRVRGAENGGLPLEQVVAGGSRAAGGGWVLLEVLRGSEERVSEPLPQLASSFSKPPCKRPRRRFERC